MKNFKTIFTLLIGGCCFTTLVNGQRVAPYSLSPKWVFGNKAMFDFTTGSTPSQPARPAGDNIIANEGGSTLCSPNKNVMVYDNGVRVGGNNNVPLGSPYMSGSSSSTQGGIILPNPNSPTNQFFIITGNAESTYPEESNDVAKAGINVYSSSQSGSTVTNPSFVSLLAIDPGASGSQPPVREYLYSSADANYGYWILSAKVDGSGNSNFYAWPISSTGSIGSLVTSSNSSSIWNEQYQGSVKINRCQNKIALVQAVSIQVYNWDRTTGKIGSLLQKYINSGMSGKYYGCEFSPDGNYLFFTTLDSQPLSVMNISTGTVSTFGQNASGSLQLGPNGVIYVANGLDATSTTSVGVITNPNSGPSATYNASGLALANSSSVRLGISNIPWLNPQKPTIASSSSVCGTFTFTPSFKTYFNDGIGYNKAVWDFGDGTATVTNTNQNSYNAVTHTYSSIGNKTITVTLTDSVCSYNWVGTLTQNVPCILPVTLVSFNGENGGDYIVLSWTTTSEVNNKRFEILRSQDGVNFSSIGFVDGAGNSSSISSYTFKDYRPFDRTNYYKLIQHDFDGQTEASKIIAVNNDDIKLSIYPNPSSTNFTIKHSTITTGDLIVTDITGKVIYRHAISAEMTELMIGQNWPDGAYVIQLVTDNSVTAKKVFKGVK